MTTLTGMTKRKLITIDHANVDSDLPGFQLLVPVVADEDLGAVCRGDGYDIRFSVDETTAIPHRRVAWSISGGEANGRFHVKVPTINGSTNTSLWVYYGDATASTDTSDPAEVFSDLRCVYDCDQTSGDVIDVVNGNNLTRDTLTNVAGISGDGYSAEGTGGAYCESDTDHDIGTGDVTLEAWVKFFNGSQPDTYLGEGVAGIVGKCFIGNGTGGGGIFIKNDLPYAQIRNNAPSVIEVSGSTTIGDEEWHYLVLTVDRDDSSGMILYVDGVAVATGDPTPMSGDDLSSSNRFCIGTRYDNTNTVYFRYYGSFDEVRQAAVARSAAWVKFAYHNYASADNELSWGSEEAVGGGGGSSTANAAFFQLLLGP